MAASLVVACALDFDRFRPPFVEEIVDAASPMDVAIDADSSPPDAEVSRVDARSDASSDTLPREADAGQ
jgi:hypothetical protein